MSASAVRLWLPLLVIPGVRAPAQDPPAHIENLYTESWIVSRAGILYAVSEDVSGQDLNGDGDVDAHDRVLQFRNLITNETTNLALAGDPQLAHGDWLAFRVREYSQRRDLNGDGDTEDHVIHLHDTGSGTTRNLALDGTAELASGVRLFLEISERG